MSIFGNILGKIFHRGGGGAPAPAQAPAQTTTAGAPATPAGTGAGGSGTAPASTPAGGTVPAQGGAPAAAPAAPAAAPMAAVDVEAVLNDMAAKNPQKLNWRTSIVDLMKLLDIDSSLQARKDLAKELNYTGDTGDSASMNIWLHKQVMKKLADNGGKVPADLKD
jgi:hypothetical protein